MNARGTILMVEDDQLLQETVAEALVDLGYTVVCACDGVEALDVLQLQQVDILFSDISMPNGVTGIELASRAVASHPALRIVLASGFARAQLPELPELPPQVSFLPKPYRISQLIQLLDAAG